MTTETDILLLKLMKLSDMDWETPFCIVSGNSCEFSSRVDFHCLDDGKKSVGGDNMDLNSKYSDSSSKKADVSIFLSKKNVSCVA
jgi:hypothetical protein